MSQSNRRLRQSLWVKVLAICWIAGLGLLLAADGAQAQTQHIAGQVRDGQGHAIGGVHVVLEASRTAFKLRSFKRQTSEPVQLPTMTDDDGRFAFAWRQDRHFTDLQLLVALPVQKAGADTFEVFHKQDISALVRDASGPLEVLLTVEDSAQMDWLRRFLDGSAHADEDRVFREMGRPERLDHDPVLDESSWWYFDLGKVYHFRSGQLDQVTHFDPPVAGTTTDATSPGTNDPNDG